MRNTELSTTLDDDIRAADAMGLSYGKYKLLKFKTAAKEKPQEEPPPSNNSKKKPRKFTDEEAFKLWQSGMTDAEIGETVGVSRAYIQRWRDQLELPSTSKTHIDTAKYRLDTLPDGTYVVLWEDDE